MASKYEKRYYKKQQLNKKYKVYEVLYKDGNAVSSRMRAKNLSVSDADNFIFLAERGLK